MLAMMTRRSEADALEGKLAALRRCGEQFVAGVAVAAAFGDARAAADGVPRRVRPFNGGLVAHQAPQPLQVGRVIAGEPPASPARREGGAVLDCDRRAAAGGAHGYPHLEARPLRQDDRD